MSVDYRPDYDPADVDSDYGHTGGDITVPTFTANMKPFRFWCQKALPLVYDDSLSYYEVLCKVVKQMNDFLTDLQTATGAIDEFAQQFVINQQFLNDMADQLGQNVQDLEEYINDRLEDYMTAYTQLQDYVNNYFDNLDVQQEINNKLDEMASDGTFNTLFDPVITAWMTTKTAQIDAAIAAQNAVQAQQNGRISVLEGRMDTFEGLPAGSTAGNAELVGIRTNFLGETYPTAGDAVRASDMIASGFMSIPATKLEEWDGNDTSSVYDTIQIDISGYKGGHVAVIGSFKYFQSDLTNMGTCAVYATNTPGKVEDANAINYFPGVANSIFKNFTQLTTDISGEERLLLQFAIPDDYTYQYLKIGHFEHGPQSGSYTEPLYIVYANSWSKTPVDPTLSIAGDAADAKAAGDAIDELNERLANDVSDRLTAIDGITVPTMELGYIAMASTSIAFQDSTTAIRTPQNGGIRVSVGDVIGLNDYTNAKYKYAILKDSDSKYVYNNYGTVDYKVVNDGVLYLVVAYSNDATISNVSALSSLVRIDKHSGELNAINAQLTKNATYNSILETNRMSTDLFGRGDTSNGYLLPTTRTYRVSTKEPTTFDFDITISVASGFKIALYEYLNSAWTRRGGSSSWITSASITKGTVFAFCIARITEDTTELADITEFVNAIVTDTNLTNRIVSGSDIEIDNNAITEFMSHFYESNVAEAYCFFTDPHLMGSAVAFDANNFNQYISILKETVDNVTADYIVCGGDWLNREDSKAQASVKLGYVDGKMRSLFPDKYYPIVGNHDFNYLGYENETRLPESGWVSNSAMRNFWFHEYDNCYYKFKRSIAQNYVLNTRTDYDGTNAYDKTMLDWLASNLIEDDAPHSTIMFHMYYLSSIGTTIPTRVVAIGKIIEAFNAHTVCTLTNATEGYDKTYDFTGTTGHIDYVIVGHTHADFTGTFGGVPVIGCVNFTKDNTPSFDLIFADYTNSKVYTTRIGSGSSREFNI